MNLLRLLPCVAALAFVAACTQDPPKDPGPKPGGPPPADTGHHGEQLDLGQAELGAFPVTAKRGKQLQPGAELDVDLEFPAGTALPPVVRAWVGVQDATGSMRTKLGKEGDRVMHGHLEVPKPLPAGSRLWVEIEPAAGAKVTGSFDLKQ